jgi:arylsulfatase A-like enzyme
LRDGLTANQTKFFGHQAQDWMLARATDAKPWFCYFALTDPHAPHEPTVAYKHTYDGERLVSPGTKDADLSDKSGWTPGQVGDSPDAWQSNWEGTLEELEGVRERCASILDMLEATGQMNNTIVIYTSDNG